MKAVLELKKENEDNIFYRYNIDGTLVWFDQYCNSGHIYTVYVRPGDEITEEFEFYVQGSSRVAYDYPEFIEINTNHERLTVDQVDGYVSGLMYAKKIAEAIMDIFKSGEHIELYKMHHTEM